MPATWRCSGSKRTSEAARAASCAARARTRARRSFRAGIELDVTQPQGDAKFRARAVVIADGGFQANLDMVREHITPARRQAPATQRRHRDRRRAAHGAGAWAPPITGIEQFLRPSAQPRRDDTPTGCGRDPMPTSLPPPASWSMPAAGASPTKALAASGSPTPSPACPIRSAPRSVFDQAIWDGPPGTGHVQPPNPLLRRSRRYAASRRHASRNWRPWLGIPAQALQETVERYNAALDAGTLAESLAAAQRRDQAPGRSDAAVLCDADLRCDHQHHGRHRGGRRRPQCSTRTTSRSRASTPPARPSAG